MESNSMLENIKEDLADNYRNDEQVLQNMIDKVTTIALSISNRTNSKENIDKLSPYIEECVKADYLSRGGEGLNSLNDGGKSSSFRNNREKMRNDIIKDGMRIFKC